MPTATKPTQNGAAATAAAVPPITETVVAAFSQTTTIAGDIVAGTTGVLTPLVRSASGKTRELSDGFAAEVKNIAGLTVNAYHRTIKHQLDFSIELADAAKVDWVGELTRHNAAAIGDLVAVYAGAAHDLLK